VLDEGDREIARAEPVAIATRVAETHEAVQARDEAEREPLPDAPPDPHEDRHEAPVPSVADDAPRSARDPASARTAVASGRAALGRGNLTAASAAFHRALELDRLSLDALIGLGELHYERGEYHKARTFAKRATTVGPRSGRAWILLGDACFKVLDYEAARAAYNQAAKVGASEAAGRLARLDKLIAR
jgi:tetratricopeptide (TPR) repeat protein